MGKGQNNKQSYLRQEGRITLTRKEETDENNMAAHPYKLQVMNV